MENAIDVDIANVIFNKKNTSFTTAGVDEVEMSKVVKKVNPIARRRESSPPKYGLNLK